MNNFLLSFIISHLKKSNITAVQIVSLIVFSLSFSPDAFSKTGIPVDDFGYYMEAHALRGSTMMGWTLAQPSFLKKFPEYNNIDINKFISAFTTHDIEKRNRLSQSVNINGKRYSRSEVRKILAKNYGMDKYALDINAPQLKQMNKAVEDLNYYDNRSSEKVFKALNFSPEEKKLYLILEESIDKTDRFMNCPKNKICAEWGKVAEPATKWVKNPRGLEIAKFLETEMGYEKYTELTKNLRDNTYLKQRKSNPHKKFREIRKEHLKSYFVVESPSKSPTPTTVGKSLASASKVKTRTMATLGQVGKRLPAVGALLAADNAHSQGQSPFDGMLTNFLFINGDNICENEICTQANGKKQFFNKPLYEQSKARLRSTELNNILNNNTPFVQNIRCERQYGGTGLKVVLTVIPENSDMLKPVYLKKDQKPHSVAIEHKSLRIQEIVFSNNGQVLAATTSDHDDLIKFDISYIQGKPQNISSRGLSHNRHNMSVKQFREIRPEWKKPMFNTGEWTRQRDISQLESQIGSNQKSIFNCCQDKKCLDFYNPPAERTLASENYKPARAAR